MTKSSRVAPHEYAISARVRSSVLRCGIVAFSLKTIISTFGTLHTELLGAVDAEVLRICSSKTTSYRTNCLNTLHTSSTKRLRSTTDRLTLQGPTNTRSSVAFANSPDGAITLTPPLAMVLNKSSKDVLGSAWNTVQGTKQRPGPWINTDSNAISLRCASLLARGK